MALRVVGHNPNGVTIEACKPYRERAAIAGVNFKKRVFINDPCDNLPHLIHLTTIARDHAEQRLIFTIGRILRINTRRQMPYALGQIRQKLRNLFKGLRFAFDLVINGAAAVRMNLRAS